MEGKFVLSGSAVGQCSAFTVTPLSSWQNIALIHICDGEQKVLWRSSDASACADAVALTPGLWDFPRVSRGRQRAARPGLGDGRR